MIYIILVAVICTVLMAKHRRRRGGWDPRNRILPVVQGISLGALASADMAVGVISQTSDEDYRVMWVKATYALRDNTAGEGPIDIGIAHGDYTAAEVEEWMEATASWTRGNKIASEQANRLIRRIGSFAGDTTEETLNDGMPITTKLNWHIVTGQNFNLFIYNHSGAMLTTGASISVQGKALIRYTSA